MLHHAVLHHAVLQPAVLHPILPYLIVAGGEKKIAVLNPGRNAAQGDRTA